MVAVIETGTGNLLKADVDALVNTVNTKGVMGKGLALQFKRAFPEVFKVYASACRAGEVEVGRMHVVEQLTSPRFIINFPTKEHWKGKSRLEYVDSGLEDLVRVVRERGIESIGIPPLGCGLGGLRWADVEPRIRAAFADMDEVRVLLFEPGHTPRAKDVVDRTKRPKMTPGRAAIIALMHDYTSTGYDYRCSLLEVQKLAYFMQLAGEDLRLDFAAHHYGPYANALWKVLRHIEGHFTRGIASGEDAPTTPLELLPGAAEAATKYLARKPKVHDRLSRVQRLLVGFETPFGMELLATVHWVMQSEDLNDEDLGSVVRGVHEWNTRKAETMQPAQVAAAWKRLRDQGWTRSASQV